VKADKARKPCHLRNLDQGVVIILTVVYVLETIRASERAEAAYERKMYRYKAQYSLDCENGIENAVLTKPQTPEMVLEEKQLQKQVYDEKKN